MLGFAGVSVEVLVLGIWWGFSLGVQVVVMLSVVMRRRNILTFFYVLLLLFFELGVNIICRKVRLRFCLIIYNCIVFFQFGLEISIVRVSYFYTTTPVFALCLLILLPQMIMYSWIILSHDLINSQLTISFSIQTLG